MGKGSNARPYSVSQAVFDNRFDAIFGKPKPTECPVCKPDPCVCTDDGPGQEEAKATYERRRFERNG